MFRKQKEKLFFETTPGKRFAKLRQFAARVRHDRRKSIILAMTAIVVLTVAGAAIFNANQTDQLPGKKAPPITPGTKVTPDADKDGTPDTPAPQPGTEPAAPDDEKTNSSAKPAPAAPTKPSAPPQPSTPPPGNGGGGCTSVTPAGTSTRTIIVNGVQRTYLIVLPSGFNMSAKSPVVMGFHGGSSTSAFARQTYGLEGSQQVMYVYPQAAYWPEAGGVGWNVSPSGADFAYFDAMLGDIKSRNCVDSGRVFAAGKSNGGFFANALACHRPAAVRAIASVAGGGPETECSTGRAVMIIHGTADPTVSISAGRYSRDYWLARNNYGGGAPSGYNPSPCISYPGTQNPVIWCEHGGGHDWPSWAGADIRNFFLGL